MRIAAVVAAVLICALTLVAAFGMVPGIRQDGHQAAQLADSPVQSPPASSAVHAGRVDPADGAGTSGSGRGAGVGAGSAADSATDAEQQDTSLPKHSGTGRRIVFDESAQRVWLVGPRGGVVRTYLVSGSKYPNLDTDTYQVYSKSRHATAYNSNETMAFMVRFAQGRTGSPIGFHSVPAFPNGTLVEARSQLGTPQSDGCVRQWINDARALWNFAEIGTTVVVRA